MKSKISISQMKKGMLMSVSAQMLSLMTSFILNLVVPKFIDEYQYAYWQTFMLYVGYVGILHFGILDGLVLRYSQYDYDELDKPRMRSQFAILLVVDGIISLGTILIGAAFCGGITCKIVILVAVGMVTRNIFTYTSYSFQMTNRINKYALLIIAQRAFYAVGIVVALLLGVQDFTWICIMDLCSDVFGVLLGAQFNRGLYFGKMLPMKELWQETRTNVSAGVLLLIANWVSQLLIGGAKMIIQWHWDDLVFGKVSFAFSVSNLFLNFVTAISVVLFPSLKRMEPEKLPGVYKSIRGLISPVLFFTMIFYFPGCWILSLWLPRYTDSLVYLGLLLPIIVFSSKVSLLTNNYLKAYRKEKSMFVVNLLSIGIAVAAYLLCAYISDNLAAMLISIVLVNMLRSILSEIIVMRTIQVYFVKDFYIEALMTVFFILCARYLSLFLGCVCYTVAVALYMVCNRNDLKMILNRNDKGENE